MNYETMLKSLFAILETLNRADSQDAQEWQLPSDARAPFAEIVCAISDLAGESIISHWAETGEINFDLADRGKHHASA